MKRLCAFGLLFIAFLAIINPGLCPAQAQGQQPRVIVAQLKGTVDYGMVRYLARAIERAKSTDASALIVEIDTLGGRVDAALDIREALDEYPRPSAAYVKGRAWSAGVLLSLSPQKLFMQSGSSIGSAEIRPLEEKALSAWRAELEAMAEKRGKDPRVAAAMADASVEIPGIIEKGRLLNLTAAKAKEIGFADGVVESLEDVLKAVGLPEASVEIVQWNGAEKIARFATDPTIAPLLLAAGIGGLFVEALVPGFGLPGLVGIVSLALFFGGRALAGLTGWGILVLFLAGLVLLTIEAFIPGFGVFGISGIICLVVSIYMASGTGGDVLRELVISVVVAILFVAAMSRFAIRRGLWARLSLSDEVKGTAGPSEGEVERLLGKKGISLTPLRPTGIARISGKRVDVITTGEFVAAGTEVEVVGVQGGRATVVPVQKEETSCLK
ncbi:MAG TPA: nodulation protein NfeD [Firmicutes bacterium]|nr:nodulation protein NfeD [Bacillota bacterium]